MVTDADITNSNQMHNMIKADVLYVKTLNKIEAPKLLAC